MLLPSELDPLKLKKIGTKVALLITNSMSKPTQITSVANIFSN
jgi:hypothetical protein